MEPAKIEDAKNDANKKTELGEAISLITSKGNFFAILVVGFLSMTETGRNRFNLTKMEAKKVYYSMAIAIIFLLAVLIIGYLFNLIGCKGINFIFAIIFTVGAVITWANPSYLAIVAGSGAVFEALKNESSLTAGVKNFIDNYTKLLLNVLFYGSIIFWGLGVIPFGENPMAFFALISGLTLLFLIKPVLNVGGTFWKYIVYFGIILGLIFYSLSIIPEKNKNQTKTIYGITKDEGEKTAKNLYNTFNSTLERLTKENKKRVQELNKEPEESSKDDQSSIDQIGTLPNDPSVLYIDRPAVFRFDVKPYESVNQKFYVKEGLKYHLSTSKQGDDYYQDLSDMSIHFKGTNLKSPDAPGIFTMRNGKNPTTISLLVTYK